MSAAVAPSSSAACARPAHEVAVRSAWLSRRHRRSSSGLDDSLREAFTFAAVFDEAAHHPVDVVAESSVTGDLVPAQLLRLESGIQAEVSGPDAILEALSTGAAAAANRRRSSVPLN